MIIIFVIKYTFLWIHYIYSIYIYFFLPPKLLLRVEMKLNNDGAKTDKKKPQHILCMDWTFGDKTNESAGGCANSFFKPKFKQSAVFPSLFLASASMV